MEKIFKKSLAIMVSAAICLTALIGCLTVSAERGEGTITVGTVEGKAGDSVTVPVELEYTSSQENGLGIAAALFDVKFDTNVLTITKIEREDPTNDAIAYTVQWRTTDGDESSIDVRDGAVRILAVGKDETAVVPSMSLNLTFTINSEAPAGASNITIENLQACDYGTADIDGIYANDEDMISMSANNGSVTVAEDQTCEHNYEFVSATPATESADGTVELKCSLCEDIKTETVKYHRLTTVASASASAESEVLMQFDAYTNLFAENADVESTVITIDKENYNAENTLYIMNVADAESFNSGSYTGLRWKIGVPAKALNDDVTVYVYCKAGDQWYNGQVLNYSFTTYAKNMLSREETPAANKTVIMDLINYGSAAQTLFEYDVENLANATFDEYQQYATPSDVIPEAVDQLVTRQDVASDPVLVAQVNLMAEERVTVRYTLMPRNYDGSAENVKAVISYTNSQGEKVSTEYINYDKAVNEGLTDKIEAGEYFTVVSSNYILDFSKLAAAEMKTLVTVDVYVDDELSSSVDYSVQSFVARMRTQGSATPEQTACYNAMLRYGDSAQVAFAN